MAGSERIEIRKRGWWQWKPRKRSNRWMIGTLHGPREDAGTWDGWVFSWGRWEISYRQRRRLDIDAARADFERARAALKALDG